MKLIVTIALTLVVCVLIVLKKEYARYFIGGYAVLMITLGILYNIRTLPGLIPFYRPTLQTFFQEEFLENGQFPDSFLSILFKDKKVYIKNDKMDIRVAEDLGKSWLYSYYHMLNMDALLKLYGAEVIRDDAMNTTMLSEGQIKEDFDRLGMTNDMYRYSFVVCPSIDETGSYFYYYWYYYEHLRNIFAHMNVEKGETGQDIGTGNELVILWKTDEESPEEDEDFYVMTKEYYDSEVRGKKDIQ